MRSLGWALVLPLVVCLCSCSSDEVDPSTLRDSQSAYDQAIEALEKHDYGLAKTRLDEAIAAGGLRVDSYVDAHIQRAICLAQVGQFDAAHKDLDTISQGAEMGRLHAVRSFVYRKEGRQGEADAEMNRARAINGTIQPIPD